MSTTRPSQGGSQGTWGTELEANLAVSIDRVTGQLVPAQVQAALGGSLSAISLFGVKDLAYGAKGDYTHFTSAGVNINDGAMTSGSPTLACTTTTPFKAADVGKAIFVPTAGSAGGTLVSTISAFVDSGHVTLAANASASVSAQTISYGTDDTVAIQAAITACAAAGGGTVFFPAGRYYTAELAVSGRGVNLEGVGLGDTGSGGYGTMLVGSSALVTDLVTVSADKCSIQRMTLAGNSYGRDVLRLTNAATRFFGDDIYIKGAGSGCGITHGTSVTSVNSKWGHVYVDGCASHGIVVNSSDTEWVNVTTFSNGGDGFRCVGTNGNIANIHPWGNTGAGTSFQSGGNNWRVANIYSETNTGKGVDIVSAAGNKITAGRLWKNGAQGLSISGAGADRNEILADAVDNTGEGFYVQAGSYNKILAGQCFDDQGSKTQTYGVRVASAATSTYIGPVTAFDADHVTAAFLDASTSTTWELGARKKTAGSDTTFNANTTLADLITIPVKAGTKWLIDGIIYVDGSQAGDLKARLQVSSGTSPSGYFSLDTAIAASTASTTAASLNPTDTAAVAASGGTATVTGTIGVGTVQAIHVSGYVEAGTADANLVLQAAQNTSDATVTTVHKESWLRATRVV